MPPMVTLDVPRALPKPLPKTAIGTPRLLGPPVVGPLSISANRIVGGAGGSARASHGALVKGSAASRLARPRCPSGIERMPGPIRCQRLV